jgi:hypothetical protein
LKLNDLEFVAVDLNEEIGEYVVDAENIGQNRLEPVERLYLNPRGLYHEHNQRNVGIAIDSEQSDVDTGEDNSDASDNEHGGTICGQELIVNSGQTPVAAKPEVLFFIANEQNDEFLADILGDPLAPPVIDNEEDDEIVFNVLGNKGFPLPFLDNDYGLIKQENDVISGNLPFKTLVNFLCE